MPCLDKESLRQLRIKVGTVKRTQKEYDYYTKEEVSHREKVKKMQEAGCEEGDIKQQQECLNETLMVIPDTRDRLAKYANELSSFMKEELELTDQDVEFEDENEAKLIDEGRDILKTVGNIVPEMAM